MKKRKNKSTSYPISGTRSSVKYKHLPYESVYDYFLYVSMRYGISINSDFNRKAEYTSIRDL
jgi:hypothetical protein